MKQDLEAWLSECLLLRCDVDEVVDILEQQGIPSQETKSKIDHLLAMPLFKTASRVIRDMKRLEWQMSIYQNNYEILLNEVGFTEIDVTAFDQAMFLERHYIASQPLVIRNFLKGSVALQTWTDREHLKANYGQFQVEVKHGDKLHPEKLEDKYFAFADFLDLIGQPEDIKRYIYYMTAYNATKNQPLVDAMMREIVTPDYGAVDDGSHECVFLWVGPPMTKARFHIDMKSGLLTQVVGRKRVLLAPPHHIHHMYMMENHFASEIDVDRLDAYRHQLYCQKVQPVEVVLEPGDAVFLPATWWHYVEALDESISLTFANFKWFNDYQWFHQVFPEFDKL
ncbi:MAG: cupin-like domain-containing protein [Cyanobacteria bacterium HKST-UBA05]|nr:cupin-like domain-containing protein [Cyanobacteria bacterium HKST-UBA05]